jgi:hypothetical protein
MAAHFLHRSVDLRSNLLQARQPAVRVTGIVVHDHWKPYYLMTGVLHALCNAHHLCELKALVEIEREEWVRAPTDCDHSLNEPAVRELAPSLLNAGTRSGRIALAWRYL